MKKNSISIFQQYSIESIVLWIVICYIFQSFLSAIFTKIPILQIVSVQFLLAIFNFALCYGLIHKNKANVLDYFCCIGKLNLRVIAVNFVFVTILICIDFIFSAIGREAIVQEILSMRLQFDQAIVSFFYRMFFIGIVQWFYIYANFYLAEHDMDDQNTLHDIVEILKVSLRLSLKTLLSYLKYVIGPIVIGICLFVIFAGILTSILQSGGQNTGNMFQDINSLDSLSDQAGNFLIVWRMILPLIEGILFARLFFAALLQVSFLKNYLSLKEVSMKASPQRTMRRTQMVRCEEKNIDHTTEFEMPKDEIDR